MEENTTVSETAQVASTSPKPVPNAPPKVVREAEHKLKEMSRKAKERSDSTRHRGTAHNASKQSRGLSEMNYFWLVIGGLSALGVGYLVFGTDRREPPKPPQRFKFVPPPGPKTPEKTPAKEPIVEKEEKNTPKFELNCF